jgi:hypothetical protein
MEHAGIKAKRMRIIFFTVQLWSLLRFVEQWGWKFFRRRVLRAHHALELGHEVGMGNGKKANRLTIHN